MNFKTKLIFVGVLLGLSAQVFADSDPEERIRLKSCLEKKAIEFVEIPASTVGLHQSSQIQALFELFTSSSFNICNSEKEDFKANVSSEQKDLDLEVCSALTTAVSQFVSADKTEQLMAGTKTCGGFGI